MKNIDKIRQMNSEELTHYLIKMMNSNLCDYCIVRYKNTICNASITCSNGVKQWLEQEVRNRC